ncbi:hypothetical protein B296_00032222 [Ensete ventricosum]|uniref:LRAT domain-containing protein n=1 Tax=Ensete ventricosum TaxID=4639 RepID=A0A426YPM6_ENSVE|nr:hypothetical protein B296_00032222 [Ensete ventricosum]
MGLLSNRVERREIKAGDHIYSWRAAYTYSHHGRYITDIGVRKDVVKVAVEDLAANLGWHRCPKESAPGKDCDASVSVASIEEEKRLHL